MIAASLPDRRQVEFGERVVTDQRPSAPSPRVRWKLPAARRSRESQGSIPACAGETVYQECHLPSSGVHPRVCGGNAPGWFVALATVGPSPRVRGKHAVDAGGDSMAGSIPACAGETSRRLHCKSYPRVHPRVCGGNDGAEVCSRTVKGPSPRVRGKPDSGKSWLQGHGSIPACAGETLPAAGKSLRTAVHPRVCGGKREIVTEPSALPGVHPRVCGGNYDGRLDQLVDRGPSPRVRGKPGGGTYGTGATGSIPACAGETFASGRSVWVHRVHPRVCGGNLADFVMPP